MATITGLNELTGEELAWELQNGGKFVYYQYTVSLIVVTFKRASGIHFIRSGNSAAKRGLPYSLLTLLLGWWGIPWGPIYTIQTLVKNLGGGVDVTREVISQLKGAD
ncbi:MAG: hypothetical protein LBU64_13840 [Planctomycetota bacterium]|nr:hypothetical protein [Planctomycetota bacterium]